MQDFIHLPNLLSQASSRSQQITSFALVCLGVVESLANGAISSTDSIRMIFHAENCRFVRDVLQDETTDEIMSRGVQLADLFDALPVDKAQQEYQRELLAMHALCLGLIDRDRQAA